MSGGDLSARLGHPRRRSPSSHDGARARVGARRVRSVSPCSRSSPCASRRGGARQGAVRAKQAGRPARRADRRRTCSSRRRAHLHLRPRARPSHPRPQAARRDRSGVPKSLRRAHRRRRRVPAAGALHPAAPRARGAASRRATQPRVRRRARRRTPLRIRSRMCAAAPSSPARRRR